MLNRSRLQIIDASPTSAVVLGIQESGQVVAVSSDQSPPVEVPGDLPKAIGVRTGSDILAAQLEDGTWRAWGKYTAQPLIDTINEFSRPVLDISTAGTRLMWLE